MTKGLAIRVYTIACFVVMIGLVVLLWRLDAPRRECERKGLAWRCAINGSCFCAEIYDPVF